MSSSELIENQPIFSRLQKSPVDVSQPYTGEKFFQKLAATIGPEAATNYLREAGVQGMSYPAKGHYSFYDPSLLQITPEYKRLVNPAGFYSRAHEVASTILPEGPRTWQEMRSLMMKQPGMKEQEMVWSGLHPEAYEPGHKLTREEIAEQVEKNFPMVGRVIKGSAPTEAEAAPHLEILQAHGFQPEYTELPGGGNKWLIRDLEEGGHYTPSELSNLKDLPAEVSKSASALERMAPMHEQYTVPGGKNYSERVLTHEYNDPNRPYVNPEVESKYAGDLSRLKEERDALLKEQKDMFDNDPSADPDKMIRKINANTEAARDIRNKIKEESRASLPEVPGYTTSKFRHESHLGDINNPIVHTRNSERVGPNGEKILHQEELQSDWGQQGREKGFRKPMDEALRKEMNELDDAVRTPEQSARLAELRELERRERMSGSIPNAPFVGDTEHWLELAAKDTLAHAIENDFDKIFITGGQEQAKRWKNELRKVVDNVAWQDPEEFSKQLAQEKAYEIARKKFGKPYNQLTDDEQYETYMGALGDIQKKYEGAKHVVASDKSGVRHTFLVKPVEGPNGKPRVEVVDSSIPSAKGETLSAVVGGDLAKRIMAEESGNVPMKGYRMGSEGYTQTYERKAPSVYKKLMKTLDPEAKVEAGSLHSGQNSPTYIDKLANEMSADDFDKWEPNLTDMMSAMENGASYNEALHLHAPEDLKKYLADKHGVHGTYLHITPKMKEAYRKLKAQHGSVFPAYKKGGTVDAEPNSRYTGADRRLLERALHLTRKLTE